jgi:endonuclease/exonuclease/phosphatase (EEP) superfamily protein YafD
MGMSAFTWVGQILRSLFRATSRLLPLVFLACNLLGLAGFIVRDRSVLLAFLLYLPLFPIGLLSILVGILRRKSLTWWLGDLLIAISLIATISSSWWMFGWGPGLEAPSSAPALSLLHWNVLWGGYWNKDQRQWNSIVNDIVEYNPDILVLSEAPPMARMYQGLDRLPGRRFHVSVSNPRRGQHAYHIFVSARWPVWLDHRVPITNGAAALIEVDHPAGPLRILLVDGRSEITRLRTEMLHDIGQVCASAAESGEPIDLIVGDFNAVSRSIGFDSLASAGGGYHLSSRYSLGWRGTWPAFFPVFDIDHVWVHSRWRILGCLLFTNLATDHRGQIVRFVSTRT